ncbi:hypothetical protein F511_02037 [Dorcoceras hygrometricum]|uniref:Uncharacterized protein n=1 Tax=Dorcoceras hygrometricum TaxID=472368 RepID=A0A2Z7BYU7_9LAMI|nr:hypothetical protein F511_02037 [Dorcoceras hygrometricum]
MLTNTRHFLVQSRAKHKIYQQQLQLELKPADLQILNQNQQHSFRHDDVTSADSKISSTIYSNLLIPVSPKSTLHSKIQQELHPFRKFLKSREINPNSNQLITNLTSQSSQLRNMVAMVGRGCAPPWRGLAARVATSVLPSAARDLMAAVAAVRPPSEVISGRLMRRLIFPFRFCSGLSRAAHEGFGPIFDIGPILVDFEIFDILGIKSF